MGSPSLREALRGLYVSPPRLSASAPDGHSGFCLIQSRISCATFHLAVRTLDAVNLTMLPLEVSRVNESRSFILKLPRSCILTVGGAKVDRPVRHRCSPCEDYAAAPARRAYVR